MQEIKSSQKLKWWPSPQDYNEAVQNPRTNFADEALMAATVHSDKLGLPKPITGGFASVYRLSVAERDVALRCFLRNIDDQEKRYAAISKFVRNDQLAYTVGFDFLHQGVMVNSKWFPALKMDWVEGCTLDEFVRDNLDNPHALEQLTDRFATMLAELRTVGIAHGDLQHGNILVKDGELYLVDYDGMFVPSMVGMQSNEVGHRNYQHPGRNASHFGPELDNFSAWVIYASLRSIALDPGLFEALAAGDDCLLFRAPDFTNPRYSHTFWTLENHLNPEVVALARSVRWCLSQQPEEVPALQAHPLEAPGLLPVESPSASISDDLRQVLLKLDSDVRARKTPNTAPVVEFELQTPPPRRTTFNERSGRYDPRLWQFLLLLNPFVWMMAFMLLVSLPQDRRLVTEGVDYHGEIMAKQPVTDKYASHFDVSYSFNVGARSFSGVENVSSSQELRLPIRHQITVRALPDNPDVRLPIFFPAETSPLKVAQERVAFDSTLVFWLATVNIILSICIWLVPLRHRALVSAGTAVLGTITGLRIVQAYKTPTRYVVDYTFDTVEGAVKASIDVDGKELSFLKVGDKLTVIYDSRNPDRSHLYKYCFYKAVGP